MTCRSAARERGRLTDFMDSFGIVSETEAVMLYLGQLLDIGGLSGGQIRHRLVLLDEAARLEGLPRPSRDITVRIFVRGLHQLAPVGPARERQPLYVEDVRAILDTMVERRVSQARQVALVLLANATGIPDRALRALTWHDIRLRPDRLEVTVRRSGRPQGPTGCLTVEAKSFPGAVAAIASLRRKVGPTPDAVFTVTPGEPCLRRHVQQPLQRVLARPGTWSWASRQPRPEPELAEAIEELSRPTAREQRDLALVSLGFAAGLSGLEVRQLRVGDVERGLLGLLMRLPGRRYPTAVPIGRGTHCAVRYWDDWQRTLERQSSAGADAPAFPAVCGGRVAGATGLDNLALIRLVAAASAAAGLQGNFSWMSLRTGFVRSAIRAGVPEPLILQQAGLVTLGALQAHVRRERLLSHSVAGQVGL